MLGEVLDGKVEVYFTDGTHFIRRITEERVGVGSPSRGKDFDLDCDSFRQRINIKPAVRTIKYERGVYDIAKYKRPIAPRLSCMLLIKYP